MTTSEPGPDRELRERVARACHAFVRRTDWQALEDWPTYQPLADAILAEIEQAGDVVVRRDRWLGDCPRQRRRVG